MVHKKRASESDAPFLSLENLLMTQWSAGCPDESRLVVEHGETKFLSSGGHLHINRHHHALGQNLLVRRIVKGLIDFCAARPQVLAVRVVDTCVHGDSHLLFAT